MELTLTLLTSGRVSVQFEGVTHCETSLTYEAGVKVGRIAANDEPTLGISMSVAPAANKSEFDAFIEGLRDGQQQVNEEV